MTRIIKDQGQRDNSGDQLGNNSSNPGKDDGGLARMVHRNIQNISYFERRANKIN